MELSVNLDDKFQKRHKNNKKVILMRNAMVHFNKQSNPVLDIDYLTFNEGERVAVIGPSGAGKTTLLRLINGYVQPDYGNIEILGYKNCTKSNRPRDLVRRVGFIFQHFNLIERASVFENVLWGRLGRVNPLLSLFGWFPEQDKRAAMRAIEEVNLTQKANQRADSLSGGEMQRVGIARVLAQEAEIILADEPVSSLDPALADDILELLTEISQRHGVTLIMNLHQPVLAKHYANRIIGLRQGRIVYDGDAHLLNTTALQSIFEPGINTSQLFNTNVKKEPSR
jgi:phosphonate transport system ATP-binding protein